MAAVELRRVDGLAYREALPEGWSGSGPVALMLHGYPQSSYVWRHALEAVADAGWRGVAPDLPGFGDSEVDRPGTWERLVESVERFRLALGLDRVALAMHDWGGLVGMWWACEHPDAVSAMVVSASGFFPDGKWHGVAQLMRTEEQGEDLMANITPELLAQALRSTSPSLSDEALAECWKCMADEDRRAAKLEMYRSGDFAKLERFDGRLAALGVPTLLLWGAGDEFARVATAHRLERELPDTELAILEDAGHFVFDEEPVRTAAEIAGFLGRRVP